MSSEDELGARMTRLADLIEEVEERCTPEALAPARALLRAVLDVHQSGLKEILGSVSDLRSKDGQDPIAVLCAKPSVASLLMMHDLHPDALLQRVTRALDAANLALPKAHAAIVRSEGACVWVRVQSSEPGHAVMLGRAVERLVCEHAPDAELIVEGGEAFVKEQLIPLSRLHAQKGA